MIGTPTRAVNDTRESEQWQDKTKHQVVWRGTITGIFHVDRWDWRSNQRDRAAMLGSDTANQTVLGVLVEGADGSVGVEEVEKGGMVEKWLNIGVIEHVRYQFLTLMSWVTGRKCEGGARGWRGGDVARDTERTAGLEFVEASRRLGYRENQGLSGQGST